MTARLWPAGRPHAFGAAVTSSTLAAGVSAMNAMVRPSDQSTHHGDHRLPGHVGDRPRHHVVLLRTGRHRRRRGRIRRGLRQLRLLVRLGAADGRRRRVRSAAGRQPLDAVEPLADRMRLFTRRRLGDQWVAVQARSAVELALWDIVGKVAGRSVSSLIGSVRDRVEVYASSVFLEEGGAAARRAARAAARARRDQGEGARRPGVARPTSTTLAEVRACSAPTSS